VILVVACASVVSNHARLTLEAIERTGSCPFLGWVGNRIDPGFERLEANLATLARLLGDPPLAVLPLLEAPHLDAVATALGRCDRLRRLGSPAEAAARQRPCASPSRKYSFLYRGLCVVSAHPSRYIPALVPTEPHGQHFRERSRRAPHRARANCSLTPQGARLFVAAWRS